MKIESKVFVRLDRDFITALVESKAQVFVPENHAELKSHWVGVEVDTRYLQKVAKTYLTSNPESVKYLRNTSAYHSPVWMETKGDTDAHIVILGVSLSTLTPELMSEFSKLRGVVQNENFESSVHTPLVKGLVTRLTNGSSGMLAIKPIPKVDVKGASARKTELTKDEQTFADMLKGLDLWYEYSDSNSVYRAGKKALDAAIIKAKSELAFSEAQCYRVIQHVKKVQTGK